MASLSRRSPAARDRALHVLAAMRRDPKLSLTHAARLQGVKSATVKKYVRSALKDLTENFKSRKATATRPRSTFPMPKAIPLESKLVHRRIVRRFINTFVIWDATYAASATHSHNGEERQLRAWSWLLTGAPSRPSNPRCPSSLYIARSTAVRCERSTANSHGTPKSHGKNNGRARASLFRHACCVSRTITRQAGITIQN